MQFKVDHKQYVKEGKEVRFSGEMQAKVRQLISRYPEGKQKSALLPLLHLAQEELGGYLSADVMDYIAGILGIQPVEVYEVATFYTQFSLEERGKFLIEICRTAPCAVCGGEKMSQFIQEKLGIRPGETTPDGLFTLREVECLGACGNAPVMQVNTGFHENLSVERISEIIDNIKSGSETANTGGTGKWAEELF
ncbi:MAG TPA: NAD(P)H-dependent oxidoreductase subunit E [Bacteroidales bacterium]|nr:NAD(P)H-dependent oxidoreductase subunit E [Bacteroidales bacterium]